MIKEKKKILYYWLFCIVSFLALRMLMAILDGSQLTPFFDAFFGILGAILFCATFVFFVWAMVLTIKGKASKKIFFYRSLVIILLVIISSILCFLTYSINVGLSGKDALQYFVVTTCEDKKTFVATNNICSIKTPDNWMKFPPDGDTIVNVGNGINQLSIRQYIKKDIITSSLDKVTEIIIGTTQKDIRYPIEIERKDIKINNAKVSIILTIPVSGKNITWTYTIYILEKKDAFYHFICSTASPNKKYTNKIFRLIVESFEELPVNSNSSKEKINKIHNEENSE